MENWIFGLKLLGTFLGVIFCHCVSPRNALFANLLIGFKFKILTGKTTLRQTNTRQHLTTPNNSTQESTRQQKTRQGHTTPDKARPDKIRQDQTRPHICHRYHKICHVEKLSDFCKEFEQFVEFYRNLCRFCSKFLRKKICVEKK